MEVIWAALTLGFLGSFHCIGMCGPIALALPVPSNHPFVRLMAILSYNMGRMITYGVLGLLFGLIGQGLSFAGFQKGLSITMGILMLLVIWIPLSGRWMQLEQRMFYRPVNVLKEKLGKLLRIKSVEGVFGVGLLNGLLPCGLVYVALAAALATGSIVESSTFMMLFGAATIPMMTGLMMLKNNISVSLRNQMRKAVPVMVSVLGVLLILRGLNLGIPYISPAIHESIVFHQGMGACH
jgi:uncharacterized protein